MQVILSTESPDLPGHQCLVLGVFSDEKPPRGICGFIDWRLNGFISREIKAGRITGDFLEKVIIPPYPRRINAELLLLCGMGTTTELSYDRISTAARSIMGTVDGLRIKNFAFELPGENREGTATADIVEAMIAGFFEYLSQDIDKLSGTTSCIVTSAAQIKEVSAGIRQFKSRVKDMGSVDAGDLETCPA